MYIATNYASLVRLLVGARIYWAYCATHISGGSMVLALRGLFVNCELASFSVFYKLKNDADSQTTPPEPRGSLFAGKVLPYGSMAQYINYLCR